MDRSVAQGGPDDPKADSLTSTPSDGRWDRRRDLAVGAVLGVIAFGIYMATQTDRFYDHFVWQASAFLEGQAAIRYPVESSASGFGNWFFQDVLPVASTDDVTRGLIPFPPLPALILLPFVAAWGLSTDDQTLFTALVEQLAPAAVSQLVGSVALPVPSLPLDPVAASLAGKAMRIAPPTEFVTGEPAAHLTLYGRFLAR